MMEKTLLLLKPSAIQQTLIGEITSRMEKKGLRLAGIKMIKLNDNILNIHYNHLMDKPFFRELKESMKITPVIVQCWVGIGAISIVRRMIGATDGREATPGTIRGDYSINI